MPTSAQWDALARAADRVREWVDGRLDDDSLDIARLYKSSRDKLLLRLRRVYEDKLALEPTLVHARRTGAAYEINAIVEETANDLTDYLGRNAVETVTTLLADQPRVLNREYRRYIGADFEELPYLSRRVMDELTTSVVGGGTFFDHVLNWTDKLRRDAHGNVRTALVNGQTFDQLRNNLLRTFGVEKLREPKYAAYGAVKVYKNAARAEWNKLMQQTAREHGALEVWWAVLDENTTPGCAARHGRAINEIGGLPPIHINDRCTVAVMPAETDLTPFRQAGDAWLAANGYSRRQASMMESSGWPWGQTSLRPLLLVEDADPRYGYASVPFHALPAIMQRNGVRCTEHWLDAVHALGQPDHVLLRDDGRVRTWTGWRPLRAESTDRLAETFRGDVPDAPGAPAYDERRVRVPRDVWTRFPALRTTTVPAASSYDVAVMSESDAFDEAFDPTQARDERGRFASGSDVPGYPHDESPEGAYLRGAGSDDPHSPYGGPMYFVSKSDPRGLSLARIYAQGHGQGGRLLHANVVGGKFFDPLNDSVAAEIMDRVLKNWPETARVGGTFAWTAANAVIPEAQKRGYNRFRVYEPSTHTFSHAVTDPDLVKIVRSEHVTSESNSLFTEAFDPEQPRDDKGQFTPAEHEKLIQIQKKRYAMRKSFESFAEAVREAFNYAHERDAAGRWMSGGPGRTRGARVLLVESDRALTVLRLRDGRTLYHRPTFDEALTAPYDRVAVICKQDGLVWSIRPANSPAFVLPGGHIEDGESMRAAAEREFREETGVTCRVTGSVGILYRPWSTTHVFTAEYVSGPDLVDTPEEISAVARVPVDQLARDEALWLAKHLRESVWEPDKHPRDSRGQFADDDERMSDKFSRRETPQQRRARMKRMKVDPERAAVIKRALGREAGRAGEPDATAHLGGLWDSSKHPRDEQRRFTSEAFDAAKHPRVPAGSSTGGEFSTTGGPHITRDGAGRWRTHEGRLVVDDTTRDRINKLKIPPAWTNVRVSTDPDADLQVTGIDAKGRTQYIYSAEHSERAAAEKFERLKAFNGDLPAIRDAIARDLANPDLPESEREAAAALRLIDKTGFRVGSDAETGGAVKAYGATTLLTNHVTIRGDAVSFAFTGKKGVRITKTIHDAELAKDLATRKQAAGRGGRLFDTTDASVRDYLHSRDGEFKVKDFRTWHGTTHALEEIAKRDPPTSASAFKKAQLAVSKVVAEHLGNTPAVARASYIDPAVWSPWKAKLGNLAPATKVGR